MVNLIENSVSVIADSQNLTDWEILNRINPKRLQRMLLSRSEYASGYIEAACELISAYHQVYRRDLLQLRHQGYWGKCPPPTSEQLQRIAALQQNNKFATPQQILTDLQKLASSLRSTHTSGA